MNKQEIQQNITTLKDRKSTLLDSFLDGDIEKSMYKEKMKEMEMEIMKQEEKLIGTTKVSREKLKKIKTEAELLFSLYDRESQLGTTDRLQLLKNLKAELFISNKKELQLANSRLIETLQKLKNHIWYSHGELNSDLSLEKAAS